MKASGTVYRSGSRERVVDATVKASGGGDVRHVATDDDGDFAFDNLLAGEWTLVAMQEESFPGKPQNVTLNNQDVAGLSIYLSRVAGEHDQKAGYVFFGILTGLFALWLLSYILMHSFLPPTREPVSLVLGDQVAVAIERMEAVDKISEDQAIIAAAAAIDANLTTVLDGSTVLNRSDKALLKQAAADLAKAVPADDKVTALTRFALLHKELTTPVRTGFAVWNSDPWRLLEILLWGLAGVLINKLIVSGWYLRSHRFYREGIVMHVAHLIATPLLVLVTVLLLSLASIQVTVAGSQVTLDLSSPGTLVVAAFLLGTVSWPLWNFIESTARRITGPQV